MLDLTLASSLGRRKNMLNEARSFDRLYVAENWDPDVRAMDYDRDSEIV